MSYELLLVAGFTKLPKESGKGGITEWVMVRMGGGANFSAFDFKRQTFVSLKKV